MSDNDNTSEARAKSAKENWRMSHQWAAQGDKAMSHEAAARAIEDEKCADSWLYRTFGW